MVAWSFSAVTGYETCPKKHYHTKVKKDFKESFNDAANYGSDAHKHFELRMKEGKKLPMDLQHHENLLATIAEFGGEILTEQRLAITKDFKPTGYFDKDVWGRGQADLILKDGDTAMVVDYKFGKMKDGYDQLELMCAFVACLCPEIERFIGMFYWAKEKQLWRRDFLRTDMVKVWNNFLPRIKAFEDAHKTMDFPDRPSGLCRNYCPVTTCPYNGGYR